jgi:DNA repair exonuclease SbcCD ATPase subunit
MQSRIDAQTKAEIAWDQASRRLEKDRVVAQADVNNVSAAIREQNKTIAAMIAAADKLKNLGAGVDPKDAEVLEGLQSRRLELDAKIRELAKFETIDAEVEKARIALSEVDAKEEKAKAALEAVIAKQQSVVASFTHILADRSTAILPTGRLDMEDDGKNIEIVWVRDDKRTRRDTLSGGEQATFDAAMGYALAPKALVIIEAAEVDTWAGRDSLSVLLAHLEKAPCDLLVMTCHDAKTVPEGWSTVTLGVD